MADNGKRREKKKTSFRAGFASAVPGENAPGQSRVVVPRRLSEPTRLSDLSDALLRNRLLSRNRIERLQCCFNPSAAGDDFSKRAHCLPSPTLEKLFFWNSSKGARRRFRTSISENVPR